MKIAVRSAITVPSALSVLGLVLVGVGFTIAML